MNEYHLTDDAFLSKMYTIKLDNGDFLSSALYGYDSSWTPKFALRLSFDRSPYPPREERKKSEGMPDGARMWERTDFCSRQSERSGIRVWVTLYERMLQLLRIR